ncbi:hypothetical protein BDV12DRAFT_194752 [Aspergillus spectabilis]
MATANKEKPPQRIPCSFSNCKLFFPTLKAMKKHKSADAEHDYCRKCDLDCDTEEQLLIHMIKSDKHIVCPVCAIEFGSEGGRDGHIRQFHRTSQNLACYGCKLPFRSAAGLMRHIENGECSAITQETLLFEQSKKLMQKEAIEAAENPGLKPLDDDPDDDADGGVDLLLGPTERNREAMANQPKPRMGNTNPDTTSLIDMYWPKLPAGNTAGLEEQIGDLLSFTEVLTPNERNSENVGWKGKGREPTVVGSDLTYNSKSGTGSASTTGTAESIGPPDPSLILQKIYKDWDPRNFIDKFTGEYLCPCGKRCRSKEEFEAHVLTKSQGSRRMQCPGCFKIFRSTTALIAHCESASTRCDVKESDLYAQIVDEVSGGILQITGYNEDGTLKYEAGKVDLPKKKNIGVDLNKVEW